MVQIPLFAFPRWKGSDPIVSLLDELQLTPGPGGIFCLGVEDAFIRQRNKGIEFDVVVA